MIDLRSDTVTRPTPAMKQAMVDAVVGDDVLGDDPTVIELESVSAKMLGMEAALFVPSGTMGNQIAIATHTKPGEAMIAEEEAHVVYYEVGAPAVFAGLITQTMPSERGIMDPDYVEKRIMKSNLHTPGTSLLCLENTHNRAGGSVYPLPVLARFREISDRHGLAMHLDGARVFNASVAQGIDIREISKHFHTVNFCLSKGLRTPIGSVLCGPAEFIERAKFWRKRMGGGMRQSGILAACGLVALRENIERLAEDHARAKSLANELGKLKGICTEPEKTETNIVLVHTEAVASIWQEKLADHGVACFAVASHRLRLVTHGDFDDAQLTSAIEAFAAVSSELS